MVEGLGCRFACFPKQLREFLPELTCAGTLGLSDWTGALPAGLRT